MCRNGPGSATTSWVTPASPFWEWGTNAPGFLRGAYQGHMLGVSANSTPLLGLAQERVQEGLSHCSWNFSFS